MVLSIVGRILVLCSRVELDDRQAQSLRALLLSFGDWRRLIDTAVTVRVAPMLERHLSAHAADLIPDDARAPLMAAAQASVIHALQAAATARRLQERALDPTGTRFLFYKGVVTARHYFGEWGLRPSKDIDVLVERERVHDVLDSLEDDGWIVPERGRNRLIRAAQLQDGNHLLAISPDGIHVEVHWILDRTGLVFDPEEFLARAREISIDGWQTRVPAADDLACLLAVHHLRHRWLRLHWLYDFDALQRSKEWDQAAAFPRAKQLGVATSLRVALAFAEQTTQLAMGQPPDRADGHVMQAVQDFARILSATETGQPQPTFKSAAPSFAYDWQYPPGFYQRYLRWRLMFVSASDVQRLPLPRALWWLYPPLRTAWRLLQIRRILNLIDALRSRTPGAGPDTAHPHTAA